MNPQRMGLRQRLALAVFLSIALAALVICITLYYFNQKRVYRDNLSQSEEIVQAGALPFSHALVAKDEVLLDALINELKTRKNLHITDAYVLRPDGKVVAHSRQEEFGKVYGIPRLLKEKGPASLSEVVTDSPESFSVVSLLEAKGQTIGALVVRFSTAHISRKVRSEMLWIIIVTVPVLILSGLGVLAYGQKIVKRLELVKGRALEMGRGEWGEPIKAEGSDEITDLTTAFNRMRSDMIALREKDRGSAETIQGLNRGLTEQLRMIKGLKEQLADENAALREELRSLHNPGEIIGWDGTLKSLIDQARQLASLPVTVLITGESGTGKELLARFLHEAGSRSKGPFITVNCAALPSTLFESELFGHEKGAFTGAISQKKGKFEIAHGGTLFLDEVGEIPTEAQAKLLRSLQTNEINRLGSESPVTVDVRVLAATNRDLQVEVREKRFREDLFYRLKVVELRCPPLRDRLEDLPVLLQHFIETYSRKLGKGVLGVSPSAIELLRSYGWPGNIRELENMTARAVALSASKVLGPGDFTAIEESGERPGRGFQAKPGDEFKSLLDVCGIREEELTRGGWEKIMDRCEAISLDAMLKKTRNQKEAAEAIGLNPTRIHRLIKKHNLDRKGH